MSMKLDIPSRLSTLVQNGQWPADEAQAMRQNLRSLVSAERIHWFAPDEDAIYLSPPPFRTLAKEAGDPVADFWVEYGALHEVDPGRALILGDFGLGSDAPIILQYGPDSKEPSVWRLKRASNAEKRKSTTWVQIARDFDDFVEMLGLDS